MALYTTPSAQVYISGMLSKAFNISNGTRQGCPLSPLIFNLLMEPLATYIRSHPQISGFMVGGVQHTISLFADDIILMLTNVETSLASAHQVLQLFTTVSYYKVNETKSHILGVGIPARTRHALSTRFPFPWKEKGISYLGITLTSSASELVRENYTPFLQRLHTKLEALAKFELSWSGRLAAFKMQVLPQLLYVFRTLPIPVPSSFFLSAQSTLNKFLWGGKRARCAFHKIIKHRRAGGIGHTHIKDNYIASIFAQLKGWLPYSAPSLGLLLNNSRSRAAISTTISSQATSVRALPRTLDRL